MDYILTLILFFPAIAALFAFFIDEKSIRVYSIFAAFLELAFTIILWINFSLLQTKAPFIADPTIKIVSELGFNYQLKVDGISLFLVILSSFITLLTLISLNLKKRVKQSIIAILLLEMTMMGVFLSNDAILFYLFWELSLLPMLYIIGYWGGENKIYAAVKFFIYTFFGSMFLLIGIITLSYLHYKQFGAYSFSLDDWKNLTLPFKTQVWLLLALSFSFAIKTPLFPFHTWLPYAHGKAPTVGSILLAAVLLKMGTYGFVRFDLLFFPDASLYFAPFFCIVAIIMVIYASFIAFFQEDIKQAIAYSSIAHMGIVMLGIFSMSVEGVGGALFLMISHGLVSGGLFMLVGFIYDRRETKLMSEFGGVAKVMPLYSFLFAIVMLGSIGLPLTIGFVGEFLSLLGVFRLSPFYAIFGGLGIIMGAIYSLNLYKRTFFGELSNPKNKALEDLNFKELFSIVPIAILVFVLGVFPNIILKDIDSAVKDQMTQIYEKSSPQTKAKLDNTIYFEEF